MNFDESLLFEICCEHDCTTWEKAREGFSQFCSNLPDGDAENLSASLCIHAIQSYATGQLPSSRQHILRLCKTYAPELLETLPLKLDGASSAHVMEVLAALERKFGLVVTSDVAFSTDLVQHLLAHNRALTVENEELRDQLMEGQEFHEKFNDFMRCHQAIVKQLYEAMGSLQKTQEEKILLQSKVSTYSAMLDGGNTSKSQSGSPSNSQSASPARGSGGISIPPGVAEAEIVHLKEKITQLQDDLQKIKITHADEMTSLQKKSLAMEKAHLLAITTSRESLEKVTKLNASKKGVQRDVGTQATAPGTPRKRGSSQTSGSPINRGAITPSQGEEQQEAPQATNKASSPSAPAEELPQHGENSNITVISMTNDGGDDDDEEVVPVHEVKPVLQTLRDQNMELRARLERAQQVIHDYQIVLQETVMQQQQSPGMSKNLGSPFAQHPAASPAHQQRQQMQLASTPRFSRGGAAGSPSPNNKVFHPAGSSPASSTPNGRVTVVPRLAISPSRGGQPVSNVSSARGPATGVRNSGRQPFR